MLVSSAKKSQFHGLGQRYSSIRNDLIVLCRWNHYFANIKQIEENPKWIYIIVCSASFKGEILGDFWYGITDVLSTREDASAEKKGRRLFPFHDAAAIIPRRNGTRARISRSCFIHLTDWHNYYLCMPHVPITRRLPRNRGLSRISHWLPIYRISLQMQRGGGDPPGVDVITYI